MKSKHEQSILDESFELFLRYGFKKVTMADIAAKVGISRPTLYQAFSNKEAIFETLVLRWSDETLEAIETRIRDVDSAKKQLEIALQLWLIEPYMMFQASPEAAELRESGDTYACECVAVGYDRLEDIFARIFKDTAGMPRKKAQTRAHLLTVSLRGFKAHAEDLKDLRALVAEIIDVLLAA